MIFFNLLYLKYDKLNHLMNSTPNIDSYSNHSSFVIVVTPQEGFRPSPSSSFDELGIIGWFDFLGGTT
jgi:hypothetical protein